MKISIIGSGNVGSLSAMRIAQELPDAEIALIDIVKGIAKGKSLDLMDARSLLKLHYNVDGSEDLDIASGSDIIVITAGLARKPGMLREELFRKNADIVSDLCSKIKKISKDAVVIIVTNPLDLMTMIALKSTGFDPERVLGMGISLDASRFANLISLELNIPVYEIEPVVIGVHGEGMLPLGSLTSIKGIPLPNFLDEEKIKELSVRTIQRGKEIVDHLGSGSAFFAPSAAIASLVKSVAKDEKRIIGVSAYLNGQYGLKDICLGVPCRIGKKGIEQILELQLTKEEKEQLYKSAQSLGSLNKLKSG
ncbi:MAG: malate dehydrogenase [Candidatus Omnitrophota bacterium]|jgi:malate dehydrogenase|nr:MAG: malate dehydrogenase [Candidatus Omnitrophota bacterium]